jgi:hypothetical protein
MQRGRFFQVRKDWELRQGVVGQQFFFTLDKKKLDQKWVLETPVDALSWIFQLQKHRITVQNFQLLSIYLVK